MVLNESLTSLRATHAKVQHAAAERDEALRHSLQSQKMELVGNLTSGVAHDLNNLLTVIMGAVILMRDPQGEGEGDLNVEKLLDDLDEAATRSALTTSQLLALRRVNGGQPEPVDLGEVLQAPHLSSLASHPDERKSRSPAY